MESEHNDSVEVCINLLGELGRNITMELYTEDGPFNGTVRDSFGLATPDEDYLSLSEVFTFAEEGTQCFNICLLADFTFENEEIFMVFLASDDPAVIIETTEVAVLLLDSDSMYVTYALF